MPIGVYIRKNPSVIRKRHCVFCKAWFTYRHYASQPKRQYCSGQCHMGHEREKRRKVPHDFALLYDLYWNQNQSLIEMAERFQTDHCTVKRRMIQLGIPRRKVGVSRLTSCIISGCSEAIYRIVHTNNGSPYGRRCLFHWVAHRKRLAAEYYEKIDRWKRMGIFNVNGGPADIAAIIDDVVPKALPYEIREEVCQELALELLTRKVSFGNLRENVQTTIKRFFKEYQDKYGDISLDAPITEDGLTLGDMLLDDGTMMKPSRNRAA